MLRLVVLDRDGVINHDRDDYVKNVDEWEPIERSMDAIANLTQAGWHIVVATNQSGIGRKLYSVETLNAMHAKMHRLAAQAGGRIDAVFFCPHTPSDKCDCRKPSPGMLFDIAERFNILPEDLIMVGDSMRDLQAVASAGGTPMLVKTGNGEKTLAQDGLPDGTLVFGDLYAAAEYLIKNMTPADKS